MPRKPTPAGTPFDAALPERRARGPAKGGANALRRLKGALKRPVKLEWRNGQLHVALVERRRAPFLDRTQAHLCAELGAVLLTQHADEASTLLTPLLAVHDKLKRGGWDGVAALPTSVLARALRQAQMLAAEDASSPALAQVAERLRLLLEAAEARTRSEPDAGDAEFSDSGRIEVGEASFDEFEELERVWARTRPSGLAPLDAVR